MREFKAVARARNLLARRAWSWFVNGWLASPLLGGRLRARALSLSGVRVGDSVEIRERVEILGPDLVLGDRAFVNVRTVLNNSARITIGEDVAIAPGVLLTTTAHDIGEPGRRQGRLRVKPITIGAGTWIGASATVLPGVEIGKGCVIAAGALVTRDCEPHGLYAGVPARRVRDLAQEPYA